MVFPDYIPNEECPLLVVASRKIDQLFPETILENRVHPNGNTARKEG